MSENRKYTALAASLCIVGLAFTGCSSTDNVTATGDVPLPDDGGLDDGSDRTTGGVFSTGTWKASGTNADGNPFEACFNVSVEGNTLTTNGSTCTSYQNAFSVDVDGTTDCNFYYDGAVTIADDGTFSVSNFNPDPRAPVLSMEGTITNGDAAGTITVDNTAWGGNVCVAKWVAYAPGNTVDSPAPPAPDPDDNTAPPTAAGLWLGTGPNADGEDQWSCFFVDSTGTKLTLTDSTCTDRQQQNTNQFNVQIERGDNDCYVYLGNQDNIEVPIVNGKIVLNEYKPNDWAPTLSFEGTFDGTSASGTITVNSQWPNGSCTGKWNVNKT